MKSILVFVLLLHLTLGITVAQYYQREYYDHKDGLPYGEVMDLHVDQHGVIWALYMNEIARFNGNEFTRYRSDIDFSVFTWRKTSLIQSDSTHLLFKGWNFYYEFNIVNGEFTRIEPPSYKTRAIYGEDGSLKGQLIPTMAHLNKFKEGFITRNHGVYYFKEGITTDITSDLGFDINDGLNPSIVKIGVLDNHDHHWFKVNETIFEYHKGEYKKHHLKIGEIQHIRFTSNRIAIINSEIKGEKERFYTISYDSSKNQIDTITSNRFYDMVETKEHTFLACEDGIYVNGNEGWDLVYRGNYRELLLSSKNKIIAFRSKSEKSTFIEISEDLSIKKDSIDHAEITSVCLAKDSVIVLGTEKGLILFNPSKVQKLDAPYKWKYTNMKPPKYYVFDFYGQMLMKTDHELFTYDEISGKRTSLLKSKEKLNKFFWNRENGSHWMIHDNNLCEIHKDEIIRHKLPFDARRKSKSELPVSIKSSPLNNPVIVSNHGSYEFDGKDFNKISNYRVIDYGDHIFSNDKKSYQKGDINFYRDDKIQLSLEADKIPFLQKLDSKENFWVCLTYTGEDPYSVISVITKNGEVISDTLGLWNSNSWAPFERDKLGNIWVKSDSGLTQLWLDKNQIRYQVFNGKNGFMNTSIQQIHIQDNIMYLASDKGLIVCNLDKFSSTNIIAFENYTHREGVPNIVGYIQAKGDLIMGHYGANAFLFDYSIQLDDQVAPEVRFEKIEWIEDKSVHDVYINPMEKDFIEFVHPGSSSWKMYLEFESIKFTNRQEILYRVDLYQDENQIIKGDFRSSKGFYQFQNLSPGNYQVYISSRVGELGTPSDPSILNIKIKPLWHQTTWFKIFVLIVVLVAISGLLYKVYKMRVQVLKDRQIKLEGIVKERTKEVEDQKEEILDSIKYAKRIQEAILPPTKLVKEYLSNSFILYKPKDIVAGDFYWFDVQGDDIYFAAADCTGHGVPGAMVSVVCANALNRTVNEMKISEPAEILNKVRELVVETFEKSEHEVKDGMDISFCKLNLKTRKLTFSGAHNPLYRITALNGEADEKTIKDESHMLLEYKGDKQPIGKFAHEKPFTQNEIQLNEGDSIYISSDGYPDQFGGENGRKYMYKRFKKFILSIHQMELDQQKNKLNEEFENWRGKEEQIDDVCVIGVRV